MKRNKIRKNLEENSDSEINFKEEEKTPIEKIYQKKSQVEHILLRPDSYVGSINKIEEKMWVLDEKNENFLSKTISYSPGLYKIFDEILVNAIDNIQSKN